ncbi:MAG: hypothetical protein PUE12_01725 [Oscillospiraceae bacterium]|nr:hypothetical protein [Oscillospiraceae bacterium]
MAVYVAYSKHPPNELSSVSVSVFTLIKRFFGFSDILIDGKSLNETLKTSETTDTSAEYFSTLKEDVSYADILGETDMVFEETRKEIEKILQVSNEYISYKIYGDICSSLRLNSKKTERVRTSYISGNLPVIRLLSELIKGLLSNEAYSMFRERFTAYQKDWLSHLRKNNLWINFFKKIYPALKSSSCFLRTNSCSYPIYIDSFRLHLLALVEPPD